MSSSKNGLRHASEAMSGFARRQERAGSSEKPTRQSGLAQVIGLVKCDARQQRPDRFVRVAGGAEWGGCR
jgi:hypothetical protein